MTAIPAGLEAFAKCPTTGCPVMVYGSRLTENHCRAHGGAPAFELDTDEYGNPRTDAPGSSTGRAPTLED